ncbi:MAG TPA: DUF2279 domain-containing protein [Gemmatimonadaceae bacterium]|nr:DUF2279 domain-containing protein [Gemmatimonadaceae bacterium]
MPSPVEAQVADSARAGVGPITNPPDQHAPGRDAWTGPDKVKHFFISAFIESFAFATLRAAGAEQNTALAAGLAVTAAAATGRELHDRKTKGIFSIPDLLWDAAGAAAAFLLLTNTQH